MTSVDPKNVQVRGLLSADVPTRYAVPKYQRSFEWKKDQAEEMWDDISNAPVFLGTLVLNSSKAEKEGITTIVDGQQRLTTISILLAACRTRVKELDLNSLANEIQRKLSFTDDTDASSKEAKLLVSKSIQEVYNQTIANSDWDGSFTIKGKKRQVNKIRPIYSFFWEKIKKFEKDDIKSLLENIYGSNFVAIYIQKDEEAFDIFERTNARGLDLNAAELLKNFFYSEEISDDLEKLWDEIVERSDGNMLRLIKYYYVSKYGYVQKSELYKKLRHMGKERGAQELFSDLRDFADYYFLTTAASDTDLKDWIAAKSIKRLQTESNFDLLLTTLHAFSLFKATQIYPLLIALMRELPKNAADTDFCDTFLDFIQALEKFLFINYAVAQRPGNQIEVYLAKKSEELGAGLAPIELMAQIKIDLRGKLVGSGEFIERFSALSYENDKTLIYYFFDRLNNSGRRGGEREKLYNPDHKLLRKNFDCDHFVPQKYTNNWPEREELDEIIHSMGNMLVIARHTNGSMNDILPTEKFAILNERQGKLSYIKQFIEDWEAADWSTPEASATNIRTRTENLADLAYSKVWKF